MDGQVGRCCVFVFLFVGGGERSMAFIGVVKSDKTNCWVETQQGSRLFE